MSAIQLPLFSAIDRTDDVAAFLVDLFNARHQPSPAELVRRVETELGMDARWDLISAVNQLLDGDPRASGALKQYLRSLEANGSLARALRGEDSPDQELISTLDLMLRASKQYRSSSGFREMIDFIGRFRDYAPYNNMLVRVQNPSCSFYATARDWSDRFHRQIKEDARPMLILAPMHPVMLVYALDETEGPDLPQELINFSHFQGKWNPSWLSRLIENAMGHGIRVDFKTLSSTNGGFATLARASGDWKMRIAIHDQLDEPSQFGVLCHEVAHILLGHLGTDYDNWWPGRTNLSRAAVEVEAEAVAWIVTTHLGLSGSSSEYVSRHLSPEGQTPAGISPDMIAKVAGHVERMATEALQPKKPRVRKEEKRRKRLA